MAEPDLIETLPDGRRLLTVIQDIHISRHGTVPVQGPTGELGKWRLVIGWAKYELGPDGQVLRRDDGQPKVVQHGGLPAHVADLWAADLTRLTYAAVRELAYRYLRGGAAAVAEPLAAVIVPAVPLVDVEPAPSAEAAAKASTGGLWRGVARFFGVK